MEKSHIRPSKPTRGSYSSNRESWRKNRMLFPKLGDYDAIGILSFPNNISAAALSMALTSRGGVKSVKTTPLVTWEEGIEAMKKAKKATYKPPESNPMIDRA